MVIFGRRLPLIDWISIFLQILIDGAGITGNISLLIAIMCKSPKSLKYIKVTFLHPPPPHPPTRHIWIFSSYNILLTNGSMIDVIAALTCLLSIERMIPSLFGTAMVYLDPCTLFSPLFCHLLHSIMMNAQTHSIYLVAASFFLSSLHPQTVKFSFSSIIFLLFSEAPSRRIMTVICISILMLPLFMAYPFLSPFPPLLTSQICTLLSIDDEFEVRESFRIIYDLDDYVVQGEMAIIVNEGMRCRFYILSISILIPNSSINSFNSTQLVQHFLGRGSGMIDYLKVNLTLEAQREIMSKRTIDVHKTLVKVGDLPSSVLLKLPLACPPAIFTLTIICYVIERGGIHHSPVIEHFIRITISLMTTIGPYISIFNIRVFRDFLFCRNNRIGLKVSLSFASAVPSKSMRNY
uniref:G protein-coupled receptor n=1 Tax=Pristionchus pacificus TaxID=54126 RepID=A0A8R1UP58_PRIPA